MQAEIDTRDALRIVGMSRSSFRVSVDGGWYTCAPQVVGRNRRSWGLDDLLVLAWYDVQVKMGNTRPHAGRLAAELRAAIAREPRAPEFNLYGWEVDAATSRFCFAHEPPAEAPDAEVVFVVPVDQWRLNVSICVDAFFAREAGRHGSAAPS